MKALIVEPERSLPLISFAVSVRGGRLHEPAGRDGLARIAGRMLRRGCKGYSAAQIEERLDSLGGEMGAHVGLGTTTISGEVLARNIEPFLELVATIMSAPSVDVGELARLKRQACAELVRSRDNDGLLCGRALRRHLFDGHPHGRRVGGTLGGIESIGEADVRAYLDSHLTSGNAIVCVSGDIDETGASRLAETLLAGLPQGEPHGYPADEPAAPQGKNLVIIDKPERSQTQMGIGMLGTHTSDDDHTALLVANTAFGGTFTARLIQEIRAKRGWSYGASSVLTTSRIREAFSMWTAPGAEDAPACLALELEMLRAWHDEGITADELSFCQGYLRRSSAFDIDTAKKRVQQKLERLLFDLPDDWHATFVDRVAAVTLDRANAAVKKRISPDNLWVSVVATNADTGDELRQAAGELATSIVEPADVE